MTRDLTGWLLGPGMKRCFSYNVHQGFSTISESFFSNWYYIRRLVQTLFLLFEPRHMPYLRSLISTFVVHGLDSMIPILAKSKMSRF